MLGFNQEGKKNKNKSIDSSVQKITGTSPQKEVIHLVNLLKIYTRGEMEVIGLKDIHLIVYEGEFVSIMGPSGSGKSTLMNILGCLDRPTSGSYFLLGQDISHLSRDERARVRLKTLGFVFQGFHLLARTSALENVELPMLYAKIAKSERQEQAKKALARVGLVGREGHTPAQLSGGQQQRVAIARALVNHPYVLLADEPTGNLDSRTSIEVMALLQELNAEGLTIILVTHEPDIAQYTKRKLFIKDGRLLLDEVIVPRSAAQDLQELDKQGVEKHKAEKNLEQNPPKSQGAK